jgi:hypothetical protein
MMAAAAAASDRRNICQKFRIKHISTIRSIHILRMNHHNNRY